MLSSYFRELMRAFVIQRIATLVTIVTVGTGCDKAKGFIGGDRPAPPEIAPGEALNLAARPVILFQIFGEKEDPRMIPIAAIEDGQLKTIALSSTGWHQFDAMYLRGGKTYKLYQDGRSKGTVTVRQGMWERPETPLYTLPGCQALTPLASVTVTGMTKSSYTVEALASSFERGAQRAVKQLPDAELARTARRMAMEAGAPESVDGRMLDALDFRAVAINTGATDSPTIVASFIDPTATDAGSANANTVHLFVIADRDVDGYSPTLSHVVNGPIAGAVHRRFFDHIDLTGDGVDEIVAEEWRIGQETSLLVFAWTNGRWREIFRGRSSWCLDEVRQ
ncbi:MAG TPA: hypothetical protein VJ650_17735 [Gemmatimonadaceae bacterium]|nr:hypothetical protein [Gemmatimonadaceae bacterium]